MTTTQDRTNQPTPVPTLADLQCRYPYMFDQARSIGWEEYPGWMPILADLCEQIDQALGTDKHDFHWTQIKEKFGAARFYFSVDLPAGARCYVRPTLVQGQHIATQIILNGGSFKGGSLSEASQSEPPAELSAGQQLRNRLMELRLAAEAATQCACMVCGEPASVKSYAGWCSNICQQHQDQFGLNLPGDAPDWAGFRRLLDGQGGA